MGIQCAICEELLESAADSVLSLLPNLEESATSSSSRGSRNKSRKSLAVPVSPKDIVSTPCGHLFHEICLQNWFKKGSTCPACRKSYSKSKLIKIFPSLPSEAERDLEKELADVKGLLDQQNTDRDELKLEFEALQLQLSDKSDQLHKESEETANLQVIVFKLQAQHEESICEIENLRVGHKTLLDTHKQEHESKCEVMERNQVDLNTQVSVLTEEKERLVEHKNNLLNQVTALEDKNEGVLKSSLEIHSVQQDEIIKLVVQNSISMDKCKALDRNQAALNTQLGVVSEERDNLSKREEDLLKRIESLEVQKESDERKISQLSEIYFTLMEAYEGLLDKGKSILDNEMAKYRKVFASSRRSLNLNDVLKTQHLSNQNARVDTPGPVNKRTGEELEAHFSGDLKKRRVADLTDERTEGVVDDVEVLEDVSESNEGRNDFQGVIPSSELVFENDKTTLNLVSNLPNTQLPELHLTCNTRSNPIIEVIGDSHEEPTFDSANQKHTSFDDFLLTLKNIRDKVTHGKYWFKDLSFRKDKGGITKLVSMCGNFLTVLRLTACNEKNPLTIPDLKKFIFDMAPVLRELEIGDPLCPSDGFWAHGSTSLEQIKYNNKTITLKKLTMLSTCSSEGAYVTFSKFLAELFPACANLEFIEIISHWCNAQNHKDVNLSTLLQLHRLPNLDKLKSVIMENVSNNELKLLVNLSELGLKLCSFDTSGMRRSTLDVNLLNDFLKLQASSLQKLNVKFHYEKLLDPIVTIHLPKMQVLDKLNYIVGNFDKENIEFESLGLNFPNLKTFALHQNRYVRNNVWNKFMCLKNEHHGIETLVVDDIRAPDKILQLVKLFPNVCKFKVKARLTPQTLLQVWNWTNLKCLEVKAVVQTRPEYGYLDELITGIPTKQHEDLKRLMSAGVSQVDLDKVKTQAGISDLKNLCELTLDIKIDSASAFITDISGYYGFAFARRIRTLNVFPADGISTVCRTAIQNALGPSASIHFRNTKNILLPSTKVTF